MFSALNRSLRNINYKLFAALLLLGLVPTVYNTVRVTFLGQLPDQWAFSIAGQLSWVNLWYEVLNEAILLPLFFFIGAVKEDAPRFTNRVQTGMLLTFGIYTALSACIITFAEPMLRAMAADPSIIDASAQYIRIESVANVFSVLSQFALIALISANKSRYLYLITGARLVLCLAFDTLFVSSLPVSFHLGINGIGYSNMIVNTLLLTASLLFLHQEGFPVLRRSNLDFSWIGAFFKVGGVSGLESLVRNAAYTVMISKMVNVVGEQGTYWVANSFIWSWLLLPVLQLGELIKQEIAADKENIRRNTPGYLAITGGISALWFVTVPLWKPFMAGVLGFSDVDKLFSLVLLLVLFYVPFAFQNVFDSTFYGLGKTNYMLFESVVTNTVYYGAAFLLYTAGLWVPTLTGIALLFGFGNLFDSIVSLLAYFYLLKKDNIHIL